MNNELSIHRIVESAFATLKRGEKVDVNISISDSRVTVDDYSLAKVDEPKTDATDAKSSASGSFEAMIGRTAREKLTTIQGRIIAVTIWETGCNHIGIKQLGLDKDGKPHEVLWFDEGNVELVGEVDESLSPKTTEKPGGPVPNGR